MQLYPQLWYYGYLYLLGLYSSVPQSSIHSAADHRVPLSLPARCGGYRHSIDPFLIAGFVSERKGVKKAADFCAGNGIIGVLLARKYPYLHVTGFEFQWSLAREAGKLVRANRLEKRVTLVCCDLNSAVKMLPSGTFDTVVGNPPYRRTDDGRINPDREKAIARHEITLNINGFLKASSHALGYGGSVFMIYHPYRLAELFEAFKVNLFAPLRVRFVHSFLGREAVMVMVEARKNGRNDLTVESPLVIYDKENLYTEEVTAIYSDFGCVQRQCKCGAVSR